MKRLREEEENNSFDMAKRLMLLASALPVQPIRQYCPPSTADVFECKTCNRRFSSFQALGGHRTSHKKPRLIVSDHHESAKTGPAKLSKKHECSICGVVFTMGQALGGHMRRHRAVMEMQGFSDAVPCHDRDVVATKAPIVLKRSNSSVKVSWLDLNLTPLENDLKILFGKKAPKVDSFI